MPRFTTPAVFICAVMVVVGGLLMTRHVAALDLSLETSVVARERASATMMTAASETTYMHINTKGLVECLCTIKVTTSGVSAGTAYSARCRLLDLTHTDTIGCACGTARVPICNSTVTQQAVASSSETSLAVCSGFISQTAEVNPTCFTELGGSTEAACGGGAGFSITQGVSNTTATNSYTCRRNVTRWACVNARDCPVAPVDCVMSAWSGWTECSLPCGGQGQQTRTRTILVQPQGSGALCNASSETRSCNPQACSMDCLLSDWYSVNGPGYCDKPCGGGKRLERRNITQQATGTGAACDSLREREIDCNVQSCPVQVNSTDCAVSDWSAFSNCPVVCGGNATGATQTRTRTVVTPASGNGTACPALSETVPCGRDACPVDCVMSAWGAWSPCSVSCGGGTRTRTRSVITPAANGGVSCPPLLSEDESCGTNACPVDCEMTAWSPWSACAVNCTNASGMRSRTRTLTRAPLNGGAPCPDGGALVQTEMCAPGLTSWTDWSACSVSCGGGVQHRARTAVDASSTSAPESSANCPAVYEERACNTAGCPVDCVLSAWSNFSECSAACGGGRMTRTRTVVTPAAFGGAACGALEEHTDCNQQVCPTNCIVSGWSLWGNCSAPCGGGQQARTRDIVTPAAGGGAACPPLTEFQACNPQACVTPCNVSDWSAWSNCSTACGSGVQRRVRTVTPDSCVEARSEEQACNTQACPVDCSLSAWSNWSPCSASCVADGSAAPTRTRVRSILVVPSGGGAACGALVESAPCDPVPTACKIDCLLSDWSAWSLCSTTCGAGVMTHSRTVTRAPANGGAACGALNETAPCINPACPSGNTSRVDCQTSEFGAWSACSISCGDGGVRSRTRTITVTPVNGGSECPPLREESPCVNNPPCQPSAVDCRVSNWTSWSSCSVSCGDGTRTRSRTIEVTPVNGGSECPPLRETSACVNNPPCQPSAVDCRVSNWTAWSSCSVSCGDGTRTRSRTIEVVPINGGSECPPLRETAACEGNPPCATCTLSDWSPWSACSVTCGGTAGVQTRSRTVTGDKSKCDASVSLSEQRACTSNAPCGGSSGLRIFTPEPLVDPVYESSDLPSAQSFRFKFSRSQGGLTPV